MSNNASNNEKNNAKYRLGSVSEYKIGHTTYRVQLVFNTEAKETMEEILQRLINRECEEMIKHPDCHN